MKFEVLHILKKLFQKIFFNNNFSLDKQLQDKLIFEKEYCKIPKTCLKNDPQVYYQVE